MNKKESDSGNKVARVLAPRPGGERGGKGRYFFFYQPPDYLSCRSYADMD